MKKAMLLLAVMVAAGMTIGDVRVIGEGTVERDGVTGRVTVRDNEGKVLLREVVSATTQLRLSEGRQNEREEREMFMRGIDYSYCYEEGE